MTLEVYRAQWFAETGLCDNGGMGYWASTTRSIPCDTEEEAKRTLLGIGSVKEDPKRSGEYLNSDMMSLARVRKEIVFVRNLE